MLYTVELAATGQAFQAPVGRSLLEAALGAGIGLPYGCSNGSCGDCRARVVSGSVEAIAHSDFVLPAAERAAGAVLLCSVGAASDLVLEAGTARRAADLPVQTLEVRLQSLEPLGAGVGRLHLATSRSRLLRYLSGQRVRLCLPGGPCATLPLASCPCEGRHLQLHLRADSDDPFYVAVSRLRRSATLALDGPHGAMTLDEHGGRPLVLLAVDTGFAAAQGLLSQIVNVELAQPVTLVWVASPGVGHYLDNFCRALRDALDAFRYEPLGAADGSAQGLLAALDGLAEPPAWAASDVYLCTRTHAQALRLWLLARGVPAARVLADTGAPGAEAAGV